MTAIWLKLQAIWIELVAGLVILILVFALGYNKGGANVRHRWDEANAKSLEKSVEEAATLATAMEETRQKNEDALKALAADRDAAIARLRNRPDRLPAAAAAGCSGATGLQLSRPDSEFLTGLAADAAGVVANLNACYARENELRNAMIGNRKK